ncbi:MAG TPA: 2-phospho-L-lactate transferase [Actinomycetota bacterium]|nr:2-phospho-L-lactate transferase [Actinomycetota bacterium]
MSVVALAGGIGAGKFLRGLVRMIPPAEITVVVNTADDLTLHGLRICPDLDSVMYWLAGVSDRERGWGRAGETFRTLDEVRRLGGRGWFGLGDLDLATHLVRTQMLDEARSLSQATDHLRRAFGVEPVLLPMAEETVQTWIDAVDADGVAVYEPFQTWWVAMRAEPAVKAVDYRWADRAAPAPGVLEAISSAEAILICPSNPVVSIGPILAVPGIREAVTARRDHVAGVSPIIAGAPVQGMADRLMPAVGLEVSAAGAASAYRGLLAGWVIDQRDSALAARIEEELGVRVSVTDTLMTDDAAAERVARVALETLSR